MVRPSKMLKSRIREFAQEMGFTNLKDFRDYLDMMEEAGAINAPKKGLRRIKLDQPAPEISHIVNEFYGNK